MQTGENRTYQVRCGVGRLRPQNSHGCARLILVSLRGAGLVLHFPCETVSGRSAANGQREKIGREDAGKFRRGTCCLAFYYLQLIGYGDLSQFVAGMPKKPSLACRGCASSVAARHCMRCECDTHTNASTELMTCDLMRWQCVLDHH